MRLPSRERKKVPRARELVTGEQAGENEALELRRALEFVEDGDRQLLDTYIQGNVDRSSYWYALGARRLLFGDTPLGQSFDAVTLGAMSQGSERAERIIVRELGHKDVRLIRHVNFQRAYRQLFEGDPAQLAAVRQQVQAQLESQWSELVDLAFQQTTTYMGYIIMLIAADPGRARAVVADPRVRELVSAQLENKLQKLKGLEEFSRGDVLDQIAFTLYEMRVLFPEEDLPISEEEKVALIQRLARLRENSKRFVDEQFPRVLFELAVAFAPELAVDQHGIHLPRKRSMSSSAELPPRLAV